MDYINRCTELDALVRTSNAASTSFVQHQSKMYIIDAHQDSLLEYHKRIYTAAFDASDSLRHCIFAFLYPHIHSKAPLQGKARGNIDWIQVNKVPVHRIPRKMYIMQKRATEKAQQGC